MNYMTCAPTDTPKDIDIPALREKYRQEREKRLRRDRQNQYVELKGDFVEFQEIDPNMPVKQRDPVSEDIDVAIVGAGFTGIFTGAHLKEAGVSTFRHIDPAGDFGGSWYWNRYPGIQCDNDAYCYLPLLEETGYVPRAKFADGAEIYEHCQRIARKYDLYKNPLFHTWVRSLKWDDSIKRWRVGTNWGDDIRARFVVLGLGPHGRSKLPGIPGIKSFKGHSFHSARWDYAYTGGNHKNPVLDKLGDKRVAIIGTGASSIQIVPYLTKYAKHLTVFQRTPSSVDERGNRPTDPEWAKSLKPGWQKERQTNFHHAAMERFRKGEPDMVCDFWTEISRNIASSLAAKGWPELTPAQYGELYEIEDYRVMERLRRRVDTIVKDPKTAEALKPYYRFLCKRPLSNDEYLPCFNQPNVTLVDVASAQGVERITEKGLIANGVEYEVDCIIYASGFESGAEPKRRMGISEITGRNGESVYDHWKGGYKTLHGMMSHGFPNQFYTGYTQAGFSANVTEMYDQQCIHIAYIISEALKRGIKTVEPTKQAEDGWVKTINENAVDTSRFLSECTPGYFNAEGAENATGFLGGVAYGPGFHAFDKLLQDWRNKGDMEGMNIGK